MTYAQKILSLVPGGQMARFGQQEVLLTWSAGEWSAFEIACAADIDADMLVVNEKTVSLSIPPEIADNEVAFTIAELIAGAVPARDQKHFVSPSDPKADWHKWDSGEAYDACAELIIKTSQLCHRVWDHDVSPIWKVVADQCLTWVYS